MDNFLNECTNLIRCYSKDEREKSLTMAKPTKEQVEAMRTSQQVEAVDWLRRFIDTLTDVLVVLDNESAMRQAAEHRAKKAEEELAHIRES